MTSFAIATGEALLIVRSGMVEAYLTDQRPESVAVDPADPNRLYAGTWGNGLFVSADAGRSWDRAGAGVPHPQISAVAVGYPNNGSGGPLYVGTEPSTLSRSDDGGQSWQELPGLLELPSSTRWSFPPKPDTHHVRWIETDPVVTERLFVAIEAGALVRSPDGGAKWIDRVQDGPIDTHTAASHAEAEGGLYSAAGDGYFESHDGGQSWSRPMGGLQHRYLVGVAVDPGDPDTVVVSGASGPYVSYRPGNAEAYVYRKRGEGPFELSMEGLPQAQGTVASRLATHPDQPGIFYAANNHGLFRSRDSGASWENLELEWPDGVFRWGVHALVVISD